MLRKMFAGLGAAVFMLVMASGASAQVTFTASYGSPTLPGPQKGKIKFEIVNSSGAALNNVRFEYVVSSPTSFHGGSGGIECPLGWAVTATRAHIPSASVNSVANGKTCWLEIEFDAAAGTHTLSAATLSYDGGGSVPLTAGTHPTMVVAAPAPVPTLSEWSLILFGAILAGGTALVLQRRMTQA